MFAYNVELDGIEKLISVHPKQSDSCMIRQGKIRNLVHSDPYLGRVSVGFRSYFGRASVAPDCFAQGI